MDALRHVFASRIAEIKDSQNWNRLSFVSCACNGLVLMDESLQLLPVVETLDLSRNKFAKVDNLRKCTRLKHLDLGFNHLRTIASLSEVSSQIVKLVLRNNAITTLDGIENLKSLEGLDLSYNLISNFSDLEILAGLPSLQSLWLEGNPLCCARWYRAQVFSFFRLPDKLKLDEKKICTREFWKSQIIIASRQKRPASFGLYSPAKDDAEFERTINTKRKKHSRLACIEREERTLHIRSDNDSVSCDNETVSKEENEILDEETEIIGLMNRIEYMKKERSALWLLEFKDWLNQKSENFTDNTAISNSDYEHNLKVKTRQRHHGEGSRYVSNSLQASRDGSSTNILESDSCFVDNSSVLHPHQYIDRINEAAFKFSMEHSNRNSWYAVGRMDLKQEQMKRLMHINEVYLSVGAGYYNRDPLAIPGAEKIDAYIIKTTPNKAIGDIVESLSPSICPGSPPHYQQDILHRRHYLDEEFWQLSAESYSIASSDSNTSLSEDDFTKSGSFPEGDQSLTHNGIHLSASYAEQASAVLTLKVSEHSSQLLRKDIPTSECDDEILHWGKQEADWLERNNCKRKPKRRFILLAEEKNCIVDSNGEPSQKLNEDLDNSIDRVEDERRRQVHGSVLHSIDMKMNDIASAASHSHNGVIITSGSHSLSLGAENFIGNYFNSTVADLGVNETCREYIQCNCVIEQKSGFGETQVVVLLSSEHKLYVLSIGAANGSGISLEVIGCHKIEDVKEVLVGLGLQMLRIHVGRATTYLFPTRSIHISRQLLCILHSSDLNPRKRNCMTKSLEQAQVERFEKHLCGGSKISMFQYSMVLFSHKNLREDLWFPRSLFVLEAHLVVCIEDFMQFDFLSDDTSSPYYSLDSCCCITDISEMGLKSVNMAQVSQLREEKMRESVSFVRDIRLQVIDTRDIWCLTLSLERETSAFCASQEVKVEEEDALTVKKSPSASLTWKLKWFSEDSLFNFVSLLKAIRGGMPNPSSPMLVTCVS